LQRMPGAKIHVHGRICASRVTRTTWRRVIRDPLDSPYGISTSGCLDLRHSFLRFSAPLCESFGGEDVAACLQCLWNRLVVCKQHEVAAEEGKIYCKGPLISPSLRTGRSCRVHAHSIHSVFRWTGSIYNEREVACNLFVEDAQLSRQDKPERFCLNFHLHLQLL